MLSINKVIIFCAILSLYLVDGSSDVEGRKKKYHKYSMLYHGGILYYLAFLAIKVKLIFIIGTTIAAALFVGKIFAFLKYLTLWLEEKKGYYHDHSHGHDEKIVISSPHETWSSGPSEEYIHDYHRKSDSSTYPYRAYMNSDNNNNNGYTTIRDDSSYISYARSLGDTIFSNPDIFNDIVKNLDLTEYTFNEMSIKKEPCKKRFVCEADYQAKYSSLLTLGLYMFSDEGLNKYRTDHNVTSITDCKEMYPECPTLTS